MTDQIERVLASAIEGQAQSLRFIERQLSKLHESLTNASAEIRESIRKDSKFSSSEIDVLFALTLEHVASRLSESRFDTVLHSEYALARSENAPNNLAAYGTVYIVPAKYNLLYSCVSAVAAAIAAGNCVLLELPQKLSTTSEVLRGILSNALGDDTFAIVDDRIDSALTDKCISLYGSPDSTIPSSPTTLAPPTSRSIVIVDRSADLQKASLSIVRARFAFGGQAPLAPSLVLVNEFRVKEFCNAIAEMTSKYFAQQVEMNGSTDHSTAIKTNATRTSSQELDQAGAEIVLSGSKGSVVILKDRRSVILKKQITEPLIIIHPVRSLDDAMDFASTTSDKPLTALLVFGTPEVAKYSSQFVNALLCLVNEIPVELLVAPLTPIGYATQLNGPYRREMFSTIKPQYIQFGEASSKLSAILDENNQSEASKLRKQAQEADTKFKQPPGYAIGFFEQGLLFGASVALSSIIGGTVVLWKYGVPAIMKRVR